MLTGGAAAPAASGRAGVCDMAGGRGSVGGEGRGRLRVVSLVDVGAVAVAGCVRAGGRRRRRPAASGEW